MNNTEQTGTVSVEAVAAEFNSTVNKVKWAMVGTAAIALSYMFLMSQGAGSHFVAFAWPGMVLCAPLTYDVLAKLLNKRP